MSLVELSQVSDPRSFWEEARYQRVCAACGKPTRDWEAHHVLAKQHCRIYGAPRYSPDNALRLCAKAPDACHERHTQAQERVPLIALRDENIAFVTFWLGPGAAHLYLTTYYAGNDPRVDALVSPLPWQ